MSERYKASRTNWNDGVGRAHLARYYIGRGFIEPGEKVLDVGCGNGVGSEIYASNALKVHGIDYSEEVIKSATKDFGDENFLTFERVDLNRRFSLDNYDVAIAFEVLEHLDNPSKTLDRLLPSIGRLFIFSVPIGETVGENPYHKQAFVDYNTPKKLMEGREGWREFHSYRQGRHGIYVYGRY
jgi:2-polyprenyl-3-methyl-5-hydroxy-6-metoxy-1,4-benzoquinol methylase